MSTCVWLLRREFWENRAIFVIPALIGAALIVAALFGRVHIGVTELQLQGLWLYIIVTAAVWYLPVAGWLLLVSAWAKRAVILWSILPVLGVLLAERVFIGTHVCAMVLTDRLARYVDHAFQDVEHQAHWVAGPQGGQIIGTTSSVWSMIDPIGFLKSPAVWIGALVGAAMITGAIQLRMRRADS